ncbi:MAG: hypothetical protein AB7G52_15080 [Arcobacter sp.]
MLSNHHCIADLAFELDDFLNDQTSLKYPKEVYQELQQGLLELHKAYTYARRINKLLKKEENVEIFLAKLKYQLNELEDSVIYERFSKQSPTL